MTKRKHEPLGRKPLRRKARKKPENRARGAKPLSANSGRWVLHEAKARFSELVRKANTDGPQRVSVHGRDQVVVISADEYERLKGERSGQLLIELMRHSPLRDVDIETSPTRAPVRDVKL